MDDKPEHTANKAKGQGGPPPPKQQRSKEKLERILNAGYEIAAEVGFEATTLAKIAERAGVATSTVYTRFKDKEALLHALHAAATERSRATIAEAYQEQHWQERSLKEVLADVINLSLQLTEQMAGFQKACYQRALSDAVFASREALVRKELLDKTRELFANKADEIGHPDRDVAAQFFVALYISVITEHVMTNAFPAESLDSQQIGAELFDACVRYLQLDP
ncbi:Fatty acid metabolism regulator protein [Halioglobus japonicus]|nr:Fatty acid metabolism regulator protein [Halioglobus japonicus]